MSCFSVQTTTCLKGPQAAGRPRSSELKSAVRDAMSSLEKLGRPPYFVHVTEEVRS